MKISIFEILIIVFLAELPCLIRTTSLTMYSQGEILKVTLGTILGNAAALIVGLLIGKSLLYFCDLENTSFTQYIAGVIFILIGMYIMLFGD